MTDVTELTDEELKRRYAEAGRTPSSHAPVEQLSDEELKQRAATFKAEGGYAPPFADKSGKEVPLTPADPDWAQNIWAGAGKKLEDWKLAAKQFDAATFEPLDVASGEGSKVQKLKEEYKAKEKTDKPLMKTVSGNVGAAVPEFAAAFAGGGPAGATRLLPTLGRQMATGAGLELFTPAENYKPGTKALFGAGVGGVSELGGRFAGWAASPFLHGASPPAREAAQTLEQAGMPRPLAINRTDSPYAQNLTNAAEMLGGRPITRARHENLEWMTNLATEPTGAPTSFITQRWRDDQARRLEQHAAVLRAGPRVDLANVPAAMQAQIAQVHPQAMLTGGSSRNAIAQMMGTARGATQLGSITANDAMTIRRELTNLGHSRMSGERPDYVGAQQAFATRDAIDDSIRNSLPGGPTGNAAQAFDRWRAQWGQTQEIFRAADKGTEGGRLLPRHLASGFLPEGVRESTPFERIIRAGASNIPSPPTGWNRAWLSAALLGAPAMGGVAGGYAADSPGVAAAGLGTSAALWNAVARRPMTRQSTEAIRRLLAASGISLGT